VLEMGEVQWNEYREEERRIILRYSFKSVGFIFSCGYGEFIETLSALEYLEDSETVLSPSLFGAEF
jgi:hypothetical protein